MQLDYFEKLEKIFPEEWCAIIVFCLTLIFTMNVYYSFPAGLISLGISHAFFEYRRKKK
jgi:hypothetical protein